MTSNELILQFLDGTLSGDQEAEFLHILSVSPERRELLRSFMRQSALFARDKNAITIPYQAEQKLWQRLGAVMPIPESAELATSSVAEPLIAGVAASTIWERMGMPVAGLIAALVLTLGIGIGYTVGNGGTTTNRTITRWIERPHELAQTVTAQNSIRATIPIGGQGHSLSAVLPPSRSLPVFQLGSMNGTKSVSALLSAYLNNPAEPHAQYNAPTVLRAKAEETPSFEYVPARTLSQSAVVGGQVLNPPRFYSETEETPTRTLLQRFEFSFLESFGRELPSSYANNVSMPILTNAAASIFFQVLPNSEALWVGVSGGAANFSRKHLTTQSGDPGDPLQQQLVAVYAHTPANWVGAFLQYRLPLFAQTDLTMTGGYGVSTAGSLAMGELGLRYDATRDVGFTFGLRGVQLSYNLASEEASTMQSVRGPLVVPNGVANAAPSYNLEINTGLFFHF